MQRKPLDTLTHASNVVVSLAALSKTCVSNSVKCQRIMMNSLQQRERNRSDDLKELGTDLSSYIDKVEDFLRV